MTAGNTVYLETLGCQMNALDSELVFAELLSRGYRPTDAASEASLVVLNTCSVRQHAEDKVYSRLGEIRAARRRAPGQIVAVIGCMAERDGDGLLAKMPHVDILCGPGELHRLPALVADVAATRGRAIALSGRLRDRSTPVQTAPGHADLEALDSSRAFSAGAAADEGVAPAEVRAATPRGLSGFQAYVRITRGCDKYCTFCVVPYTRGPEVHRPPGRIVEEVRRLAAAGVKEVTLLGQTVNHYHYVGEGPGGTTTFAQLLRRVHDEVPELPRLRFVTSFPRDFTDEALDVMAASPRICPYLHIPAQSGSDRVLKRMNRGYTVAQYLTLLERARARMPHLSIAGDMIVGFCGETDEDFRLSVALLEAARYKNCFIFKYSPRPGTHAAARLPDDVPEEVKRARNNELLAVQAAISLSQQRGQIGRTVEVLVEGRSKKGLAAQESEQDRGAEVDRRSPNGADRQMVGRTPGDQIVVFDGPAALAGRLVDVEIIAATPYTLHGRIGPGASNVAGIEDSDKVAVSRLPGRGRSLPVLSS